MTNRHYQDPDIKTGSPLNGLIDIVIPEEGYNFVKNPSFEESTTGYTFSNCTGARITNNYCRGSYLLEVTPTAAETISYLETTIASTNLTAGRMHTFSADVRGKYGEDYTLTIMSGSSVLATKTGKFKNELERVHVKSPTPNPITAIKVRLTKTTLTSEKYYTDGWQFEERSYPTTYFDGDMPDCRWIGARLNSKSYRSIYSYGGEVVPTKDLGIRLLAAGGLGAPNVANATTPYAFIGGENAQNSTILPRVITLNVNVIDRNNLKVWKKRQRLIRAVMPFNVLLVGRKILLRMRATNPKDEAIGKELEAEFKYSGGLEGLIDNHYQSNIPLQFVQHRPPGIREIYDFATELDFSATVTDISFIHRRKSNGIWDKFHGGFTHVTDGRISALAQTPDGYIYCGGEFDTIVDGAVSANNIAKYDPETEVFSLLGTGFNGQVYGITPYVDNSIVVVGDFTDGNGITVSRIAKVASDGTAYSALGIDNTEVDDIVYSAVYDRDGKLWFGGAFTGTVKYLTTALVLNTTSGVSGTCHSTKLGLDGYIYAGGTFGVVKINPETGVATSLGSASTVYSIDFLKNGNLVAGGSFTSIGGVTANFIAQYNGSQWSPMASGVKRIGAADGYVKVVYVAEDGTCYIGGRFNADGAGSAFIGRQAYWSGYGDEGNFLPVETESPQGTSTYNAETLAFLYTFSGDLILGHERTGDAETASINEVDYTGSAEVSPKIMFSGDGRPSAVLNFTTGKAFYIKTPNLMTDSEKWFVNFDPEQFEMTSNQWGDRIFDTIREGSDTGTFSLTTGRDSVKTNLIGVLVPNADSGTKCVISWRPVHYGIEASSYE